MSCQILVIALPTLITFCKLVCFVRQKLCSALCFSSCPKLPLHLNDNMKINTFTKIYHYWRLHPPDKFSVPSPPEQPLERPLRYNHAPVNSLLQEGGVGQTHRI